MMSFKKVIIPAIAVIMLSAQLISCSSQAVKPGTYDATEVGKVNKVVPGTIVSMRPVKIHNQTDASSIDAPSSNTEMHSHGFEYVIKMSSGAIISLVQTEDLQLKVKQHVLVIYGPTTRIVSDNGSEDY